MSYHFTRWPIAVAAAVSLSGCGLDVLEGKPSPFKAEVERRAAVTLPAEMQVAVAHVAPCYTVYRVNRCGAGGEVMEW